MLVSLHTHKAHTPARPRGATSKPEGYTVRERPDRGTSDGARAHMPLGQGAQTAGGTARRRMEYCARRSDHISSSGPRHEELGALRGRCLRLGAYSASASAASTGDTSRGSASFSLRAVASASAEEGEGCDDHASRFSDTRSASAAACAALTSAAFSCCLTVAYRYEPPIASAEPHAPSGVIGVRKATMQTSMMTTRRIVFPMACVTGWTLLSAFIATSE
mmetsp:Transcript_23176/g.75328  ORF Transcript_23176/g.75328 Transcript_23176/m.75328 type:complete len:220 (-) Transcript_23176:970-1629(-)